MKFRTVCLAQEMDDGKGSNEWIPYQFWLIRRFEGDWRVSEKKICSDRAESWYVMWVWYVFGHDLKKKKKVVYF